MKSITQRNKQKKLSGLLYMWPPADRCCITCNPKCIQGLWKSEIGLTKNTQYLPRDGCGVVQCDQCVAFTCCVMRRSCHVGVWQRWHHRSRQALVHPSWCYRHARKTFYFSNINLKNHTQLTSKEKNAKNKKINKTTPTIATLQSGAPMWHELGMSHVTK